VAYSNLIYCLSESLSAGLVDSGVFASVGEFMSTGAVCLGAVDGFVFGGGLLPGMYKGPRWPQEASVLASRAMMASRDKMKSGFTIRIRLIMTYWSVA
jgi:hypothetical protein